ncbi:hypothetical protein TELCIR_20812, partial [Teladorsagia circumcincta]
WTVIVSGSIDMIALKRPTSDKNCHQMESADNKMRRFIVDIMQKQGVVTSHAEQLADVLVEADIRGHYSHGLNRL